MVGGYIYIKKEIFEEVTTPVGEFPRTVAGAYEELRRVCMANKPVVAPGVSVGAVKTTPMAVSIVEVVEGTETLYALLLDGLTYQVASNNEVDKIAD